MDNLEKIEIDAPNGNYIIEVSHKGILEEDQVFSLIVSGNGEVTTLSNKTIEKINTIFTSYSKSERKIIVQNRVPSVKTEKYEIYDITGRLINEKRLNGTNNFKIDAANLNKGVYLIRIKTDLSILTSKVIVD